MNTTASSLALAVLLPLAGLAAARAAAAAPTPFVDLAGYFAPATSSTATPAAPAGPLRFASGPAIANAELAALAKMYYTGLEGPGASQGEIRSPQLSRLIPVYRADLLAGGLETARASDSFVCTLRADGKPFAHVTIRDGKMGQMSQFLADTFPNALNGIMGLEQVKAGVFEPRLLEFGGFWTVVWLKSLGDGADFIYAVAEIKAPPGARIPGTVPNLKARTLYPANEFLTAVRPALEVQKAQSGAPRRGPSGP